MNNTITLEGFAAIEYAEAHGLNLSKYNDPTEDAREGLTPEEARAVAREDPRLIYLTLRCTGWAEGDGSGHDGYHSSDYFAGGQYQGPDEHGIEPIMEAAREPLTVETLRRKGITTADNIVLDQGTLDVPIVSTTQVDGGEVYELANNEGYVLESTGSGVTLWYETLAELEAGLHREAGNAN